MTESIIIKNLTEDNLIKEALALTLKVFKEFLAPTYSEEGLKEYERALKNKDFILQLKWKGAFKENKLLGIISTRNEGSHITFLFVEGKYHKQGIGKLLLQEVLGECQKDKMTVNSAPYSVEVYNKLGFYNTDKEQEVNGIRFIPMELKL